MSVNNYLFYSMAVGDKIYKTHVRMKLSYITLIVTLLVSSNAGFAQKNAIFLDAKGDTTSFENHHSYQISGKFKSVYNSHTKVRSLVPFPTQELENELAKTRRKTVLKEKVGEEFPEFDVMDIKGNAYTKKELLGKVVVVNFWFIGCAPCEIERPDLNALVEEYKDNPNVVFLSFARDNPERIEKFLVKRPFLYPVVTLNADLINKFEIQGYPQNQIIGKDGKYAFNSKAAGIGSGIILRQAIEDALKN